MRAHRLQRALQTVLDALRARKDRFMFEETEIALKPSTMMFITMNPGYPGRAELPESVKVWRFVQLRVLLAGWLPRWVLGRLCCRCRRRQLDKGMSARETPSTC